MFSRDEIHNMFRSMVLELLSQHSSGKFVAHIIGNLSKHGKHIIRILSSSAELLHARLPEGSATTALRNGSCGKKCACFRRRQKSGMVAESPEQHRRPRAPRAMAKATALASPSVARNSS
mmetsp:Transcript_15868/g.43449  ORF Transcript_15868/g.43449 Transcript_15868/m.43449 type:complete len:120 (-) Transcript_15868:8-367(-)